MNREVAMERLRAGSPVYGRPPSGVPNNAAASSPGMPPAHRRSPSASGFSAVRRTQNVAARAAAARLAQVMASQSAAAEEEEDEELEDEIPSAGGMGFRYGASRPAEGSNESAPAGGTSLLARANRSPSPAVISRMPSELFVDLTYLVAMKGGEDFSYSSNLHFNTELGQNFADHTPSVRASTAGRPSISVHPVPLVPPSKTTFATQTPIPPTEPPVDTCSEKRFPSDMKHLNPRGTGIHRQASSLQDELDMLQEENENIIEKLRLVEERREEAEARAKELEKQVAALGEGVSLEARLLNRKEAALQQREEWDPELVISPHIGICHCMLPVIFCCFKISISSQAVLEAIRKNKDGKNEEIAAMRKEVESAKEEVVIAKEQLRKAELEAKSLQLMTQREQVVLKRCWLARYWGLAVYYGFYPEIAVSKYEYWSSLAPLPLEVVISAGQKSMEESYNQGKKYAKRILLIKLVRDANDITGEGNIESMLSVEKGLLELTSLKVEDAVVLALSQHQRPNFVRQFLSELSQEEIEDVTFKQVFFSSLLLYDRLLVGFDDCVSPGQIDGFSFSSYMEESFSSCIVASNILEEEGGRQNMPSSFAPAWLIYFWRRAKDHGIEEDIADERLQFWHGRIRQSPISHDFIDVTYVGLSRMEVVLFIKRFLYYNIAVERGLTELNKLGIEQQLWEASRKEIEQEP
ncbi:hypothetical protein ZIOFF_023472 [Zingiber officinale]|uniref:Uncharacterized protein n=1 Tax=Zingiber officinale TaxID=94328 RepID=A0A8J5GWT6_ZINOF|nr:hypothetical protein ZIOFF_023472 [Zingiber officinale]